jgi:hypothetical protein
MYSTQQLKLSKSMYVHVNLNSTWATIQNRYCLVLLVKCSVLSGLLWFLLQMLVHSELNFLYQFWIHTELIGKFTM